jgi:transcriptional regulator with XRE-family HTH domain
MRDLRKLFGKRLSTLRRNIGLTQEQLAEATNLSVDFISLIERGVYSPSFARLPKIAKALKVSIKDLFDFDGAK